MFDAQRRRRFCAGIDHILRPGAVAVFRSVAGDALSDQPAAQEPATGSDDRPAGFKPGNDRQRFRDTVLAA